MNFGADRLLAAINVALIWRAVQKKLPLIVVAMVGAGVFAYMSVSLFAPYYSAEARIYVSSGKNITLKPDAKVLQTQITAIYADNFLNNIVRTLNLHTHPEFAPVVSSGGSVLKDLKGRLLVSWEKKSGTLNIRFGSSDPALAAEATNAIANAFLVMSKEKPGEVRTQLVLRAVTPITPEYPKKGPVALLTMSLIGLAILGYIFTAEIRSQLLNKKEEELDEKHHKLDMSNSKHEKRLNIIEKAGLFEGPKSGPAFRGIYSWQPEEVIGNISRQLYGMMKGEGSFRVIVSAETEGVQVASEAIEIARSFARQGKSTLLIDFGDIERGVSEYFDLSDISGIGELVRDPLLLEEIIHSDPETPLHIVARGREESLVMDQHISSNLLNVFRAWGVVYEVVIVCCSNRIAFDLNEMLLKYFNAGVFVQNEGISCDGPTSTDFATKVEGFDVLFYRQNVVTRQVEEDQPALAATS